jgi:hypothetical protein
MKRKFENKDATSRKITKKHPVKKIISGGQSGEDTAGLLAGDYLKIETGGYAAKNFMTTKGQNLDLKKFGLVEDTISKNLSESYIRRSKLNVDKSDGTIAFRFYSSSGTDKTISYCLHKKWTNLINQNEKTKYKPVLVIDSIAKDDDETNVKRILDFLNQNNIIILNICGNRDCNVEMIKNLLIKALE